MARETIGELLYATTQRRQDAPALLDAVGATTTYAQLTRDVEAISAAVAAAGVAPDEAVGVVLANGPALATAFLGITAAAVCAPLNPAYTEAELTFFFDDLDIAALVTDDCCPAAVALAEQRGIPVLRAPYHASAQRRPPRSPGDIALVLHTSGTTARPKQVPLTHANLCTSAASVVRTMQLTTDDRGLNVMPLFHIHGIVAALLATIDAGGSVVCTAGFDATRFLRTAAELDVTWYTAVPTMHQAVLSAARRQPELVATCRLRGIRSSSAALAPAVLRDLESVFGVPVIEAYGMTEASHQMASNPLPPAVRKSGTVGVAAGSDIAIMDVGGALLPPGMSGEIVIRGPAVTSGYVADAAVNADAFAHGWFHTGDLGVLDDDGYLTIAGRLKEIINRGGEKVSPREVEEVLLAHPDVEQVVVFARPHPTLGEDVAAAVVVTDAATFDADGLRAFAAAQLAPHKVPQRIVMRDELPLGPTGKLQRIGMADRLGLHDGPDPPSPEATALTPVQRAVADVWAAELGRAHVGLDQRFVELGGDSLSAVAVVARLMDTFAVDLPVTAPLDEGATVTAMSALVERARDETSSRRDELVLDASRAAVSFSQARFWTLARLDAASSAYNVPLALRLRGELDGDTLVAALSEITRRHEALRSSFPAPDGRPTIVVHEPSPFPLRVVDVSRAADPLGAAVNSAATTDVTVRFDLEEGPVVRGALYRLGEDDHLLVIVTHHIATDGWSRGVFRRELSALYGAFSAGEPSPLPAIAFGYPAWAAAQRRHLESRVDDPGLAYWRARLDPIPPAVLLPTDRPRGGRRDPRGAEVVTLVDETLRGALADVAQSSDATLFMTLLAGFVGLLWHQTRLEDIVVGIPVAGRVDARSAEVIGPFLNTLPIRVAVDPHGSFETLLGRVRHACLEAYEHQHVPFERIIEQAGVPRAVEHAPIVQVFFQLRNLPAALHHVGSMSVDDIDLHTGSAKFDLSIDIDDRGDRLTVRLEYPTALFDVATIERTAARLQRLLEAVALDSSVAIDAIDLIGATERSALSHLATPADENEAGWTVPDRIAAVAASRPAAVAVHSPEGHLSYEELLGRADELAHRLRRGGADGSLVGVCLPRTSDLPVALLGVLRAGAAIVPLDPTLPSARLAAVMEQVGVATVVTIDALTTLLPSSTTIVLMAGADVSPPAGPGALAATDPRSLAYAMATSGSTGTPKCALIEHRSFANFLLGFATRLGFDETIRMLASTPISFDPSLRELLLPLVLGGEVVLTANVMPADPVAAAEVVHEYAPSVVQGTPTTLRLLLDAGWSPAPSTTVLACGERLNDAMAARLLANDARLWNLYGPTETTQCAVVHEVRQTRDARDAIPIGRPLPGVVVEVVGDDLEPLSIGLPGEIVIGGSGVGRGYAGFDATRDRYVTLDRGRRYRTGDVGRWRNDGNLEFLGRNDDQLKINGVRIELGDIESALNAHPRVNAAVAGVRDNRLAAWVTVLAPMDQAELRSHAATLLPATMVPGTVVVLDRLPTLPNGKIDRAALPAPTVAPTGVGGLIGPTEQRLAEMWQRVLEVEPAIGRDDDFFALGGHSLLAIELTTRIEQVFGRQVPLTQFVTTPTIATLAAVIDEAPVDGRGALTDRSALVSLRSGDRRRPLLLWVPGSGGTTLQLHRLAAALPDGVDLMGFEAAPHRGLPEPESFAAMAQAYAEDVRELVRSGVLGSHRPFVLAGNSFGAAVVLEVARALHDDCPPGRVLLVDPLLVPFRPRGRKLKRRLRRFAGRLRHPTRRRHLAPGRTVTVRSVVRMSARLRRRHVFQPYEGSVVIITSALRRKDLGDELLHTPQFVAGAVEAHHLDGDHRKLLVDERVHDVASIAGQVVDDLAAEHRQLNAEGSSSSSATSSIRR